jgi:hypothetical protein
LKHERRARAAGETHVRAFSSSPAISTRVLDKIINAAPVTIVFKEGS